MTCDCELCELKSIFFTSLEADKVEAYCSSRAQRDVNAKDVIIRQGEAITEFIYLKEGLVKLYRDTPQGSQIIAIGKPFDFVSLLSVFADERYSYSVSALEDSTICVLKLDQVKKQVLENGKFAMKLITTMNRATDKIFFGYLDNHQKRLIGRIAGVILFFSEIYQSDVFDIPISRKEISQLVGMTIENVIRAISDLRKDGLIRAYGKNIEIIDKERLKKIFQYS